MTFSRSPRTLTVRSLSHRTSRAWLSIGQARVPCVIGRSGQRVLKREGDGATPIGIWPLREVYYRADRMLRPRTTLPIRSIRSFDGWCDEPRDRNYNRRVRLPYPASAEEMARSDPLYDLVIVIGYNDRPRRRGAGSAIFIHLARPGWTPTAGCIALKRGDIRRIASWLRPGDLIRTG